MDSESLVALGTLALAAVTAWLAWLTRRMAKAAADDQRAQWRPVLIAADKTVIEDGEGELRIKLRNVGRGPALGVHGQLRIDGPSGATIPGSDDTILPGEVLELRFSGKKDFWRGFVVRFEVWYYDIGEWWHATELTATVREQPDGTKPLRLNRNIVSEPGTRKASAKESSPAARLVHAQPKGRFRKAWASMRSRSATHAR